MSGSNSYIRVRLFLMMALQLAIWGAWAPKLFPYMGLLNFTANQQALVGSCWGIAAVVGIFFSNQYADRNFSAEKFLAASNLIGGLALIGCAFTTSFAAFFACYMSYSLCYVPSLSVTNSLAFANLKEPAKHFGTIRMGGTVGWVVVSWPFIFLLSGTPDLEHVRWIFIVSGIVSLATAAYALTLPHTPPRPAAPGVDALAWREAFKLLAKPFVLILFIVTFIDSVIHNGYFVVSDAFLTNRVGIAGNLSMVVLSLGQIAEVGTMAVLGVVLAKLGWRWTMIIGILGHALRFLTFAFMADSVPVVIAIQLIHGICYAFFFATVYIFVDSAFPKDVRTSAQGLFNLLILGIGNVVASWLFPQLVAKYTIGGTGAAGAVTNIIDYQKVFMWPVGMAVIAIALLALFFKPPTSHPVESTEDDGALPSAAPH